MKLIFKYLVVMYIFVLFTSINAGERYTCCTPGFNELTSCLEYADINECNKFCNSKCTAISVNREEMEGIEDEAAINSLSEVEIV